MAVAFSTNVTQVENFNGSVAKNITVSGANPVLIVDIAINDATATVTSVTWSLGSGTTVEVKTARGTEAFASVWAVPAPAPGAGTLTYNLSATKNNTGNISLYTGADQTTPCPLADAVSSVAQLTSETLTPANLTASDAAAGHCVATVSGDVTGVTPNQDFLDIGADMDMGAGHANGTTGVTFAYADTSSHSAKVAVRIAAAGGGGGAASGSIPRSLRMIGLVNA